MSSTGAARGAAIGSVSTGAIAGATVAGGAERIPAGAVAGGLSSAVGDAAGVSSKELSATIGAFDTGAATGCSPADGAVKGRTENITAGSSVADDRLGTSVRAAVWRVFVGVELLELSLRGRIQTYAFERTLSTNTCRARTARSYRHRTSGN